MYFRNIGFVLLIVCGCEVLAKNVDRSKRAAESAEHNNCDNVKPFFDMKNITLPPAGSGKGGICGGKCCSPDTEAVLKKQGQKEFASLLQHNSRSLQGLLNSTATTIQNHISEIAHQSENKTRLLFAQIYGPMAVQSRDPISALYLDIRRYVQVNSTRDTFSITSIDIKSSVTAFFTDLFPLVYHHAVMNGQPKDFTFEYKSCLKKTTADVQPLGDIPRQIAQSLSKSLDATRLLLQALNVGSEVLNITESLLVEENSKTNSACHDALLKMTHCPKCKGLSGNTKPCSGYCLNVLRGCLTKYVAELDSPWNGYVEGVERLVNAVKQHNNEAGVNADAVIRALDTRISEAIMYTMGKGKEIENRVKRTCGPAKFSEKEDPSMVETTTSLTVPSGKPRLANQRVFSPPPETQLGHFLTSIAKTRGFYGNLADSLCQDDSFAEPKDQHCWNGDRIGEYTKNVVPPGPDMQKYNPEVTLSSSLQHVDPRIANLADKLQHVHQMVMSSLGAVGLPESDSFMQGDGADGSGSGSEPIDDTHGDDDMRGSGSGDHPIISGGDVPKEPTEDPQNIPKATHPQQPTAGASTRTSSTLLVTTVVLLFAIHIRFF